MRTLDATTVTQRLRADAVGFARLWPLIERSQDAIVSLLDDAGVPRDAIQLSRDVTGARSHSRLYLSFATAGLATTSTEAS